MLLRADLIVPVDPVRRVVAEFMLITEAPLHQSDGKILPAIGYQTVADAGPSVSVQAEPT